MINKTLNGLFGFAYHEKAKKIVISNSENGLSFNCHLPDGEEAIFNLPKKLKTDLSANLRQLLKIAPEELSTGKYCKLSDKSYNLNFRLSIIPDKFGEKIIINIINEEKKPMSLNKLGWQKMELKTLKNKINTPAGLIIISSPARQGRSTTLYALLKELNREDKNIYFISEDNNIKLDGINYLTNTPENWEKILKHDSDIIAIDVKNDEAYLTQAIKAATTGRLVIMALEAVNALESLYKITNSNLPLKLILSSLKMITSQKLTELKRPIDKNKSKREKIGLFEIFIPNKIIIDFILNNQKDIKTGNFWKNLLQISTENEYKPLASDIQQKQRNGLI